MGWRTGREVGTVPVAGSGEPRSRQHRSSLMRAAHRLHVQQQLAVSGFGPGPGGQQNQSERDEGGAVKKAHGVTVSRIGLYSGRHPSGMGSLPTSFPCSMAPRPVADGLAPHGCVETVANQLETAEAQSTRAAISGSVRARACGARARRSQPLAADSRRDRRDRGACRWLGGNSLSGPGRVFHFHRRRPSGGRVERRCSPLGSHGAAAAKRGVLGATRLEPRLDLCPRPGARSGGAREWSGRVPDLPVAGGLNRGRHRGTGR